MDNAFGGTYLGCITMFVIFSKLVSFV